MSDKPIPSCADCGKKLTENHIAPDATRPPCPNCGSFKQKYHLGFNAVATVQASMKAVGKSGDTRLNAKQRRFVEIKAGADFHRKIGKWSNIEQVVDRRNNLYIKKIVDEETGDVLRDNKEKLSDHQGFGDAKG